MEGVEGLYSEEPKSHTTLKSNTYKNMKEKFAALQNQQGYFGSFLRGMSKDALIAKNAMRKAGESFNVDGHVNAMKEQGVADDVIENFQKTRKMDKVGTGFLEDLGRGSMGGGAAKVAGYMIGASMLVDMLNPFGD